MEVDKAQKTLHDTLQKVAIREKDEKGQFTEFTGLIGELAVCQLESSKSVGECGCVVKTKTRWTWEPDDGYDAKDGDGNKIQIKTRRLQTSTNLKGGRMGRFGSAKTTSETEEDNYCFKRGILVVLDDDFEIAEIWELNMEQIRCLEGRAKERKKNSGKEGNLLGLHLSTFIKHAKEAQYFHNNFECLTNQYGWK